jgi:hypothetical protein
LAGKERGEISARLVCCAGLRGVRGTHPGNVVYNLIERLAGEKVFTLDGIVA